MPAALQIGARTSNGSYTMTVQSVNVDELYAWGGNFGRGGRIRTGGPLRPRNAYMICASTRGVALFSFLSLFVVVRARFRPAVLDCVASRCKAACCCASKRFIASCCV